MLRTKGGKESETKRRKRKESAEDKISKGRKEAKRQRSGEKKVGKTAWKKGECKKQREEMRKK